MLSDHVQNQASVCGDVSGYQQPVMQLISLIVGLDRIDAVLERLHIAH